MKFAAKHIFYGILSIGLISLAGCVKETVDTLKVNPGNVVFQKEGGSSAITIETTAGAWNIENSSADWLTLSSISGTQQKALVTLNVNTRTALPRIDTLIVTAGNAEPVQVIVSQATSEYIYTISSDYSNLNFKRAGNAATILVNSSAPHWSINADVDWLQFSQDTGSMGNAAVTITALENTGSDDRSATIVINADYAPPVQVTVTQKGEMYPGYNTSPQDPDPTGMGSTASELATKINLGWNLGNSLEATGGETAWGNPPVTKAFIDLVKQSGFNAVRIPCSWNQYVEDISTARIKASWLSRVKEVVQYCVDNDMYVLLNIHWDGGWLENNCTPDKQVENNAKQKAFWEQIATKLRDFDEHVMFASANEPNVDNATKMAVLKSYHQTFIDAVRSTGGRNSFRVLVIQGPSTDIETTNKLMTSLPTDPVPNRMMVEIHYYTPWNFCGLTEDASWGKMFYYWGKDYHSTTDPGRNATWGEEGTVDANFKLMKNQFADKGIPVVLGEYSVTRRSALTGDNLTLHLASRAYFLKYVTQQAKANGIIPFYWDNGGTGNNGCAIFNRKNNTVFDQQSLDALLEGVQNKRLPGTDQLIL
ncbi:MAG TPA: cellulase family glycosylhydrolase [Bacteroidales bacterium]|nr:cellulase family glycosylhydrolase [Bacteroidales bacterium]